MMDKKTLGQYIRDRREELDLSLREFARKIDCSAAFVSDIELGRRYPSEEVLKKMASVLGDSIEKLESYDSRPPVEQVKRAVEQNAMYAFALRRVIDKKISPEDLIKFADKTTSKRKK
jgi:transcriptional regulator with XRE-family HTH domain